MESLTVIPCARDVAGLVLFGLFGQKNRSEAEPRAARAEGSAQIKNGCLAVGLW